MKIRKRLTNILLAMILSISMIPVGVFADDTSADNIQDQTANDVQTEEQIINDQSDTTQDQTGTETGEPQDQTGTETGEPQDQTGTETGEPQDQTGTETGEPQDQTGTETGEPQEQTEPEKEQTKPVKKYPTKRVLTRNGFKLKFKKFKVLYKSPLNAKYEPLDFKVVHKGSYRKLSWTAPRNVDGITGYIILRAGGNNKVYTQLATVKKSKLRYYDKTAKKNKKYSYVLIGYRKNKYGIRISTVSGYGRMPGRAYQNPTRYIQISNKISKHGLNYYTSPVLVNSKSSKKQHIEAMIKTAYKYLGDPFVVCRSGAPGEGLDCSGLVMQACYGAGVDLWPVNPARHRLPQYEYESRNIANHDKLRTVSYSSKKRGDLIFFCNSRGVIIHVAIYLGNNQIIHSTSVGNHVVVTGMGGGAYGTPCKVKRIFN